MTNLELIADALRLIAVLSEVESPSAEQGVTALRKLNQMMEQWEELQGISLGYFAQTSTTDDLPVPAYAINAVTTNLAIRLASEYGGAASVTPTLIADAESAYSAVLRKAVVKKLPEASLAHWPQGTGKLRRHDIETDV